MARATVPVSVRMVPELYKEIQGIAGRRGQSISGVIVEAINMWKAKFAKPVEDQTVRKLEQAIAVQANKGPPVGIEPVLPEGWPDEH